MNELDPVLSIPGVHVTLILHAITLSYPTSKVVACCFAQSRSNYFRTPSDGRRNVPGSAHWCYITVDYLWTRCVWWEGSLRIGFGDIRGTQWCFFGNAEGYNSTIVSFQRNHSIFDPFLLQTCFRSTFILLTPSSFRILCLDRMPEFLPQGYLNWRSLPQTQQNFIHSFPRFFFFSLGRHVWINDHMVNDCSHVTFLVVFDMARYAFLTKNCCPYRLAAGISHPVIPGMIKVLHDVPQTIRPTDPIEWHWARGCWGLGSIPRQLPGNRGTLSIAIILLCVTPN
jgi:hypothetical protein